MDSERLRESAPRVSRLPVVSGCCRHPELAEADVGGGGGHGSEAVQALSKWQKRAWATAFVVLCYWLLRDVFYLVAFGLAFGEPYWGFTVGALAFLAVPPLLAYFLVLEGL